jgi:hypothetical protein
MAAATANNEEALVSVRRIKEISFFINEQLIAKRYSKDMQISFGIGLQLSFTIETNVVFILVTLFCNGVDRPDEKLAQIEVQNIYEIPDLIRYQVGPAELILPETLMINLVAVSLSHTRAFMAKNIMGTPLQENNLGLMNAKEVARHFFPQMFHPREQVYRVQE